MPSESWPDSHNQGSCFLTLGKWPLMPSHDFRAIYFYCPNLERWKLPLLFFFFKALSCNLYWVLIGFWPEICCIIVFLRGHWGKKICFESLLPICRQIVSRQWVYCAEECLLGQIPGVWFRRGAISARHHTTVVMAIMCQRNPGVRERCKYLDLWTCSVGAWLGF